MRRLVFCLLALFLTIGTAAAAERVLLAPRGLAGTLNGSPALAPVVEQLRQKAARTGSLRVIVGLRVPFAAEETLAPAARLAQRRDIAGTAAGLRQRFASTLARQPETTRSYSALPFLAMEATPDELRRLAADPAVISLSEDRQNRLNLAQSTALVGATPAWTAGVTGKGQTVAILDTGIDSTHPFLAGKVVSEACYTRGSCPGRVSSSTAPGSGRPCASRRDCQHGTHVAGIVAGRNGSLNGVSFNGVAPDATLISVRVFTTNGTGTIAWDSDIIAGLQRVYDLRNTFRIAAVNLSLGGNTSPNSCDGVSPAMTAAIANLRSVGIATVAASGNGGVINGIAWPACISGAVSVGSVWDVDGWTRWPCKSQSNKVDKVACYSNTSPMLKLLAPGSAITSSVPGGRYGTWHGTSMAAPHVAGAWALLKEKASDATVDDVLAALEETGTPIADYRNPSIVTPRINVDRALERFAVVTLSGEGTGLGTFSVTTLRGTVSCLAQCSVSVPTGEQVTVTALPARGSQFADWSGDCAGKGASCSVDLSASRVLAAQFTGQRSSLVYQKLPNEVTPPGSVRITTTTGIHDCAADCTVPVAPGTSVSVAATPGKDARFTGWSGVCSATGACSYQQNDDTAPMTLGGGFATAYTLSYIKAGSVGGSVRFSTSGESCSSSCSNIHDPGTVVTLTPLPDAGARFGGWSGACRGRTACVITMTQSKSVTATFVRR